MKVSPSFSALPVKQSAKKIRNSRFMGMDIKLGERAINHLKPCDRLVVVAHPDDEVCFFGFIAKYFKNPNERVQLIYTTSGQNGRDVTKKVNRYTSGIRDKRLAELGNVMTVLKAKTEPLVLDTAKTTKMFSYARPSIIEPDKVIDISEEVPTLIRAFKKYKTQFKSGACEDIKKYFRSYPFITLKRAEY